MLNVKILRQDQTETKPYWASFPLEIDPNSTVIDVLKKIQREPVDVNGRTVAPVVWECNCLEEVCGACTMLINAVPMPACSAILRDVVKGNDELELRPLSRYPTLRDLMVDRTALFDTYRRYRLYPVGKGGYRSKWNQLYPYTRCMACGVCVESCPNTLVTGRTRFDGMAHMARLRMLNEYDGLDERLFTAMEKSGIARCSGHGLCDRHCPKQIDLLGAIGRINRACTARMFRFKGRKTRNESKQNGMQ